MADFLTAHKRSAVHEGGWCDVPGDAGGETYKGIARTRHPGWAGWAIVDAWKKKNGRPKHNSVIPDDTLNRMVLSFYKQQFWDKVWGDKIQSQAYANELYDMAVNAGTKAAIMLAQSHLEQVQSGAMSNHLLDKINNRNATA